MTWTIFWTASEKLPLASRQDRSAASGRVDHAEARPEAPGQIGGKVLDQGFAILGTLRTTLLKGHDAPSDFPVGGCHQGIDAAGGRGPRGFQKRDDASLDVLVGGGCLAPVLTILESRVPSIEF